MAITRKFGTLVYKRASAFTRGRDADRYARYLRNEGHLARVVEEGNIYVVYSRRPVGR